MTDIKNKKTEDDDNETGYIYILTNPSFPQYVKVGYTKNVEERVKKLNRESCLPFAFRIYATCFGFNKNRDDVIHGRLEKYYKDTRSVEFNGKKRTREFFAISPEDAYAALGEEAKISNHFKLERREIIETQKIEDEEAEEVIRKSYEKADSFTFEICDIKNGEFIEYVDDPSIKCKVVANKKVEYDGKEMSLSKAAKIIRGVNYDLQGPKYFTYKGELLTLIRSKKELNKINSNINSSDSKQIERIDDVAATKSKPVKKTVTKSKNNKLSNSRKSEKFSFEMCGIKEGEYIQSIDNKDVKCKIVENNNVEYNGEVMSLSKAARKIRGVNYDLQGPKFFTYKGELLTDIRKKLTN